MSKNLWPDFALGQSVRSPKTVVEEYGAGLKEKTLGLLEFYRSNTAIKDDNVVASFSIYSASLRYHFPFMLIKFAINNNYPVLVTAHRMGEVAVNSEQELTDLLAKIFSAPTTSEAIQRLMSLSQK